MECEFGLTIVYIYFRRPYNLNRIPYSNLLLVVVNAEISQCSRRVSATATEMHYAEEFPCYKLKLNDLHRRRLDECFTEHPDVRRINILSFFCNFK